MIRPPKSQKDVGEKKFSLKQSVAVMKERDDHCKWRELGTCLTYRLASPIVSTLKCCTSSFKVQIDSTRKGGPVKFCRPSAEKPRNKALKGFFLLFLISVIAKIKRKWVLVKLFESHWA